MGTSELHLIMSEVHALVEMIVPSDETGDLAMTPAILDLRCAWLEAQADYSSKYLEKVAHPLRGGSGGGPAPVCRD